MKSFVQLINPFVSFTAICLKDQYYSYAAKILHNQTNLKICGQVHIIAAIFSEKKVETHKKSSKDQAW